MAGRFGCFSALKVASLWLLVAFVVGATIAQINGNHGSIIYLLIAIYAGAACAIVHIIIRVIACVATSRR